jgi:hypothetical protein
MRLQVGVGLAAGILLCLAALSASATGNAWGTHLAEMKSANVASVGNGNGHAWGLLLADIKGKRSHGEDAENEDDVEGAEHGLTPSLGLIDMHSRGNHSGLRADQAGDDPGEDDQGNGQTPPGGASGAVGSPPMGPPSHDVAALPEPSAALLFAAGTGLVGLRLRRARR